MSLFHPLRGVTRRLSTAACNAITLSQTKRKLRHVHDPDEALKIYSDFTAAYDPTAAPASTRYVQELTVRRLAKSQRFSDIKNFLESHKSQPYITLEPFLSSLIRSYGVAGMLEDAVDTYNEMTNLGTPRTALSLNALLTACIDSTAFDRVPVYFYEFPSKFDFQPDKYSYGILLKAYCKMGSPETAMEKLKEMDEKGIAIGVIYCTTILESLYKIGSVDVAEKFWDEMVSLRGVLPDVGSYNVRLWHIRGEKPEIFQGLIEEMSKAGIKPDAISYNYLITCYCKNDMINEAMKVYTDELLKVKGHNPSSETFGTLIFSLCLKERFMTGFKVFKDSVKVSKNLALNTLKCLVEGLAKKGHLVEAKSIIRTMNKKLPPELLVVWGEVAEELGLINDGAEEIDSGEMEKRS